MSATNYVVEMWGLCDSVPIVFTAVSPTEWQVEVPADFTDGMYIVEVFAKTTSGAIIFTTAILYMTDGRCVRVEFCPDGLSFKLIPEDITLKIVRCEHC